MKETMKKILLDALKRYLPLILNALCAGACLTATGCVIARNANVNILPKEVAK
jgi:hypothetical protein